MIKIYEPIENNKDLCYQEQLILKYEKLYESFTEIKNKNLLILGCSKEDFIRIIDLIEYKNIKKIGKIYNCRLYDVICHKVEYNRGNYNYLIKIDSQIIGQFVDIAINILRFVKHNYLDSYILFYIKNGD